MDLCFGSVIADAVTVFLLQSLGIKRPKKAHCVLNAALLAVVEHYDGFH